MIWRCLLACQNPTLRLCNMKEELFVLIEDERKLVGRRRYYKLDLYEPAGITLSFKSGLFGDISKVTCSYSYSFKLPLTNNNRRILDFAEDIRHESIAIRKRLSCVFIQNGVEIIDNANLYIQSVTNCYNVVMTWDVVPGLIRLKDEDCSLNELGDMGMAYFGTSDVVSMEEGFNNTQSVVYPIYDAGISRVLWERKSDAISTGIFKNNAYPMPTVPVKYLLNKIYERYGFQIDFGQGNELVENGVVPLVGLNLSDEQIEARTMQLGSMIFASINKTITPNFGEPLKVFDAISFFKTSEENDYFEFGFFSINPTNKDDGNIMTLKPKIQGIELRVDGCITAKFKDFKYTWLAEEKDPPTFKVVQLEFQYVAGARSKYTWEERASISGVRVGTDSRYVVYQFDFSSSNGKSPLNCSELNNSYPLLFLFSDAVESISPGMPLIVSVSNTNNCISPRNIDIATNLPDIGCSSFLKSLFFMSGGFPVPDVNGGIKMLYFNEIEKNVEDGRILDWSKKVYGRRDELPESVTFGTSDFAQRNYYLMKSDDIENGTKRDETDVYEVGVGIIDVSDKTAEMTKTIVQVPFYPPYIKNRKWPRIKTGETIKAWEYEDDTNIYSSMSLMDGLKFVEPKPCIGIIENREIRTLDSFGGLVESKRTMAMRVWNGFGSIQENSSYSYLTKMLNSPFVITEKMRLDEVDLKRLDYSIPIYLDKYNSYFAIVSITRDTKGLVKCELIKLP